MRYASFTVQTGVYFRKLRRIASKERYWKFIIFAFVISFTVGAVVGGDMFTNYESTKSGFFSFTSAAIWIGIFNSIQSICREHEIIRSEYRSGMRLGAYVTAHALWQLLICVVQSGIISAAGMIFAHGSAEGLIFPAPVEYFITVLLLCVGADMMGLMISAAASDATAAMTVMPFVLILQLIMSGVLFDLSGWSEAVSCLTFSKWGMCAFGSIADLNDPALPLRLSEAFPNVIRLEPEKCYEHSPANLLTAWGICAGIGLFCILACRVILWARNRPQGPERGRRNSAASDGVQEKR